MKVSYKKLWEPTINKEILISNLQMNSGTKWTLRNKLSKTKFSMNWCYTKKYV